MLMACSGLAIAQDGKPGEKPKMEIKTVDIKPAEAASTKAQPAWSNADLKALGDALTGSWKTTTPAQIGGASADVVVSLAPVVVTGLTDILYVEMARADGLNRPYRQCFWHFVKAGDKTLIQTMEFRRIRGEMPNVTGLWAAPEAFPIYSLDNLVTTMEIEATKGADGTWTGKTATAYPTAASGATHMTSEITFNGKTIEIADRGFDAAGKQVWGPAAGQKYTMAKFDAGVKYTKYEGDVYAIDYPGALTGEPGKPGEEVTLNYAGYLDSGEVFDSSYERGTTWSYNIGGPMIAGWNSSMAKIQAGMKRRLVIPPNMAYGPRSRGKIPANATLYFDIDVVKIAPAPAAAPETPVPAGTQSGNPNIHVDPNPAKPPPEVQKKMEAEMARLMAEKQKKIEAEAAAKKAAEEAAKNGPK